MKTNWQTLKLGEICDFQRGLTYSKKDEVDFSSNIVLRATNIDLNTNSLNFSELKYIDDSFKVPNDKKVSKGSLIICTASGSKSHLGKVALIDNDYDYAFGGFMAQITPKKEVDSKYLFYIFISDAYKNLINRLSSGVNINNLKFSDLENFEIKLPSLPEQKRIVKTLDQVFEKLEKVKQNVEKNFNSSRELFESLLQDVFTGLASKNIALGEISQIIGGYSFKSTDFKKDGKYQVIRMGNVRPGIIRVNENPVFLEELEDRVLKRSLLLPNDVIITQTGTKNKRDYGFTVIIDKENYLLNQRISAIRFSKNYLPKFFLYFSWTNFFKDQYFKNETGTVGQGNVGIGAITTAKVPALPLSEQKLIVGKLDQLFDQTKKLESVYKSKLSTIEELKKSTLSKAFSKGL